MVIKGNIDALDLEAKGNKASNTNNKANRASKANNWLIPYRLGIHIPF